MSIIILTLLGQNESAKKLHFHLKRISHNVFYDHLPFFYLIKKHDKREQHRSYFESDGVDKMTSVLIAEPKASLSAAATGLLFPQVHEFRKDFDTENERSRESGEWPGSTCRNYFGAEGKSFLQLSLAFLLESAHTFVSIWLTDVTGQLVHVDLFSPEVNMGSQDCLRKC